MERFKSVVARLTVAAISVAMLVSMTAGTASAAVLLLDPEPVTKATGGSPTDAPVYTWSGSNFDVALYIDTVAGADGNTRQYSLTFDGPGVCTLSGSTVTVTGAGECVVTGRVNSGNGYFSATDPIDIIINKGTQLALTANAEDLTGVYDQTINLSASGGTTGLDISYTKVEGDCTITDGGGASNTATVIIDSLVGGEDDCVFNATRLGNANYNSVTSGNVTITVDKADQEAFSVSASSNPATYGAGTVTLTPSGGSGAGSVTYTTSGGCTNVGTTVTITSGTTACEVSATKDGGTNYNDATDTLTINVDKADQASLLAEVDLQGGAVSWTDAPVTGKYLQVFNLRATGGTTAGAITFSSTGDCTVDNLADTVTIDSLVGSADDCVVTASMAGNDNYNAVTDSLTITVAQADQLTLTASASDTTGVYGQTINLTASGGSGTGDISYTKVAGGDCTLTDGGGASNTATVIIDSLVGGEDDCVFNATRAGDDNYNSATSANVTITVDRAAQDVLVVGTVGGDYIATTGESLTLTTSGGSSTGSDTFAWVSGDCEVSGNTVTVDGSDEACVVEATSPADDNYLATTARVTISVNKANQSALTAVATPTSALVGQTVSLTASGGTTGLDISYTKVSGDCTLTDDGGALNTASVTITAPGSAACVFNATRAGNADYNPVTSANVSITVGPSVTLPTTSSSPTISRSGKNMTVTSAGTWNANGGTLSVATYQWYQCSGTHTAQAASGSLVVPGNCVAIGGVTTSPWRISGVSRRHLRVLVTRSNEAGDAYAWSATIRR